MNPLETSTPPPRKRHWLRWTLAAIGSFVLLITVIAAATSEHSTHHSTPAASAAPAAASSPPTTQAPATETPAPAPTYLALTTRNWDQIAKDPDTHKGETYIVYGEVTQFDAATGNSTFRADVGGVRQYPDSAGFISYPTNTILNGDSTELSPVVQHDLFTAQVTVTGSLSYDTQIGGSTTVPELQIDSITVIGHTSN